MKVLLYGLNYSPELTGIGKYSGEFVETLVAQGHDVRVVTAFPYYPEWKIHTGFVQRYESVIDERGVRVFRCPLWVPEKPKASTRLLHLMSFAISSFPVLFFQKNWKPDVLICVVPTLFTAPGALLASWWLRCSSWLHVQDFELDAMLGLWGKKSGVILNYGKALERRCMAAFDGVSTISGKMLEKLQQMKLERTVHFPNWADLNVLKCREGEPSFRQHWDIPEEDYVILYSGNMGKKQGLPLMMELAKNMKDQKNVHFCLVGDGAVKQELMAYVSVHGLDRVHFYPLVPKELLGQMLQSANLHLVLQLKGAADLVMPSKLTSIFAVGGFSIVTADQNTELGLMLQHHVGLAERVEPECLQSLETKVREMYNDWESGGQNKVNAVAVEYAEQFLNREYVIGDFVQQLEMTIEAKRIGL